MRKMIEALYNGNIFPAEKIFKNDLVYKVYMGKQADLSEKLYSSFTPEQKQLFQVYLCQRNVTDIYIQQKNFCTGFKMGAEFLMEVKK